MVFKFEVGEPVTLVGNTNNDIHRVGWMRGMDPMRGDIFHIAQRIPKNKGTYYNEYTLQEDGNFWYYDEDWLEPVTQKEVDTAELDAFFSEF